MAWSLEGVEPTILAIEDEWESAIIGPLRHKGAPRAPCTKIQIRCFATN